MQFRCWQGTFHCANDDIDGLGRYRANNLNDLIHIGRVKGVEYIGAYLCKGRQATDGIVKVRASLDEVVGSTSKNDPCLRNLRGGCNALDRLLLRS